MQIMAHLEQFLQWDINRDIKDNDICLLSDESKTYEWIRSALTTLRPAYIRGDRAAVLALADRVLHAMRCLYARLMDVWREQWESCRKRNGWEILCARLGAILARQDDVQRLLLRWRRGDIARIDELEEAPLPASRLWGCQDDHTLTFPQFR